MVQLLLQHATKRKNMESILDKGLLPYQPTEDGNYQEMSYLHDQPRGVYTILHQSHAGWRPRSDEAIITFPWVGEIEKDPFFDDGVCLVIKGKINPELLEVLDENSSD